MSDPLVKLALQWVDEQERKVQPPPQVSARAFRLCRAEAFAAGYQRGHDDRLEAAAAKGDDAAWAARFLWLLAQDEMPFTDRADFARCARVVEFLWNDMGEVRRLVEEAAALFRAYEAHHLDIAKRTGAKTGREEKAKRNGDAAAKLERWLAGDDTTPAAVMRDFHGCTTREQAERHPDSHQQRFATRDGYGEASNVVPFEEFLSQEDLEEAAFQHVTSNVRPVTEGPLADFGMVGGLMDMVLGDPAISISAEDLGTFRLQTPDPRFDPRKPVMVNGYRYHPATEEK